MARIAKPKLVTEVPEFEAVDTTDVAVTETDYDVASADDAVVEEGNGTVPPPIAKPAKSALSRFMATHDDDIADVGDLPPALPVHKIGEAKDYVRLHPDAAYTSPTLHFVDVPNVGDTKSTLHLIDQSLAKLHLDVGEYQKFKLTLATMPNDRSFLCVLPTENLDNRWNADNLIACERAQKRWVKVRSRKKEGMEGYKSKYARDESAFPVPKWPSQSLEELILAAFDGRCIDSDKHPALLRLLGAVIPVDDKE